MQELEIGINMTHIKQLAIQLSNVASTKSPPQGDTAKAGILHVAIFLTTLWTVFNPKCTHHFRPVCFNTIFVNPDWKHQAYLQQDDGTLIISCLDQNAVNSTLTRRTSDPKTKILITSLPENCWEKRREKFDAAYPPLSRQGSTQ